LLTRHFSITPKKSAFTIRGNRGLSQIARKEWRYEGHGEETAALFPSEA